jgi:hypothetical protein
MIWEYKIAAVDYDKKVERWCVRIDKQQYPLSEGLQHLGQQGWELVAIQARDLKTYGGRTVGWYQPTYYYIFKRPAVQE